MDGNYKLRQDPLRKCAIAALENHMKLFAIENGGQCLGDLTITSSYKKYGIANHCKGSVSVSSIDFSSKNYSHSGNEKTEAKMAEMSSNSSFLLLGKQFNPIFPS